MIRRVLRAYPTLLRVGFSEMVAYRAEFLIWILTTNLPLVMMGLWTAVAAEGPVGRFGQRQFVSYYLSILAVRLVTSSWLVWEMTMDIRHGAMATRLLRPLHPLFAYSAEHLSAVPMRVLVVSPLVVVLGFVTRGPSVFHDPIRLLILVPALAGAWLLLFFTMVLIASLALFMESALSVFEIWLGVHALLSGYLVPLELLPAWVSPITRALPFRYTLSFPAETLVGLNDKVTALRDLGVQWVFVGVMALAALGVWRLGMRRFVAFGG